MINAIVDEGGSSRAWGSHPARHGSISAPEQGVPATAGKAAPIPHINPTISVDPSGVVLVQYRDVGGDLRLQVPAESVVRAYRDRGRDAAALPELRILVGDVSRDAGKPGDAGQPLASGAASGASAEKEGSGPSGVGDVEPPMSTRATV